MKERPRKATRLTVGLKKQDYLILNEIASVHAARVLWANSLAIRQSVECIVALPTTLSQLSLAGAAIP